MYRTKIYCNLINTNKKVFFKYISVLGTYICCKYVHFEKNLQNKAIL